LIQKRLDPDIRAIDFAPTVKVRDSEVTLNGIVLVGVAGRQLLDIADFRP
jgi:hypothetical protein